MKTEKIIIGRNPVLSILKTSPHNIEKIYIRYGVQGNPIDDIQKISRKHGVPISILDKEKFKKLEREISNDQTQGVVAFLTLIKYYELDELIEYAYKVEKHPILVFLDKIQDPQNLGAIARTAECVRAQGIIVTTKDAAPINSTVIKASAGAIMNIPVAKVLSTSKTIDYLKNNGFWVVGTSPNAKEIYWSKNYDFPVVIIIGNEGKGVSPVLLKACDTLVQIPLYGKAESLNASVSAGVILFEIRRQRDSTGSKLPQE